MKSNKTLILIMCIVLTVVLVTVSVVAFVYAATSPISVSPSSATSGTNDYYSNGMMGNQWSGMMSNMMSGNWNQDSTVQASATSQNVFLPLIGFVALIGAALTGTGGAVYYLKFPKIGLTEPVTMSTVNDISQEAVTPYESVSKTLTSEERTVLDVLVSRDGEYLQKYIRAETGLSRLKTHRIVSRLAERGIVTLEKTGNTNEVHLSSWLAKQHLAPTVKQEEKLNQRRKR